MHDLINKIKIPALLSVSTCSSKCLTNQPPSLSTYCFFLNMKYKYLANYLFQRNFAQLLCFSSFCFHNWLWFFFSADDITLKFPFFFRPTFEVLENGWGAFQPEMEFNRFKEISEDWRLSYVNKDFSVRHTSLHPLVFQMWTFRLH